MKMKTRILVIILSILAITVIGIVANHYLVIREYELKNSPDQLDEIFALCACYKDPQRTCPEPFVDWENATHYIDNNICKWREK